MKLFQLSFLSLLCLATATPFPASQVTNIRQVARDETAGNSSYASVSGLKFNIDGATSYFAGTNTYWIGFLTNNADVDTVMTHLKSSGLKVLRVWGTSILSSSSPKLH
jgi:mannan endo-1,4-beta-mannosidase